MKNIPFYKNTEDNTRCVQACLRMVLKHFEPGNEYSYEELDKITNHTPGYWTWGTAAMLDLVKQGYEVEAIEDFNYSKFGMYGEKYLKEIFPPDVYDKQMEMTEDMDTERGFARQLASNLNFVQKVRHPKLEDVERSLDDGYLVLVSVNPCVFDDKEGYFAHMVLVYDMDEENVIFHDPGLPGEEGRKIKRDVFEKAMTPPRRPDAGIISIKIGQRISFYA